MRAAWRWIIYGLALVLAHACLAQVQLVKVWPEKLWLKPGQPINGTVTLKNAGAEAVDLTVEACLVHDIDTVKGTQAKALRLAPKSEGTVAFQWAPGHAGRYGHAMRARVLQGGQVIAEGENYFAVAQCYWDVALLKTFPYFTADKGTSEMAEVRRNNYNGFEFFFWAPDDFADMTPDAEYWRSGQGRYKNTRTNLKAAIDLGHANGLALITYGKCVGYGPAILEYFRERPENAGGFGEQLSFMHSSWELTRWNSEEQFSPNLRFYPNLGDPQVLAHGMREILESTRTFGWDGVRFDGHFTAKTDAETARIDGKLKTLLRKEFPDYTFGYNYAGTGQAGLRTLLERQPLETKALLSDGGLVMNEYIVGAQAGPAHPLHRWEAFANLLVQDVDIAKRYGGYYCAVNHEGKNPYRSVFIMAAGAHPYYGSEFRPFVHRYNQFFWDRALTRVSEPERLAQVPASLLWKQWTYLRPVDRRHQQLVLHLIVPPPSETVNDTDKTMPAPVLNTRLTITPAGLPGAWKITRAVALDPQTVTAQPLALTQAGGQARSVSVPRVHPWSIVVVDLER
jgi:hypothetical protein